jgi:apoptosis-inducing factor 3
MPEYTIDLPPLKDGEMRRYEFDGKAVLVSRTAGSFHVTGCKCSHYEAPLEEGLIQGHSIMCPWHHACYDVRTSVRLEPPGINDIPRFAFRIEAGKLVISLPKENKIEVQGKSDPSEKRSFVIIGCGAAGHSAAEELRRSGFQGDITLVEKGDSLPVDTPNISKEYLAGTAEASWMPLHKDLAWYESRDIKFLLNSRVTGLEPLHHTIKLENGQSVGYDKLLIATGANPRFIPGIKSPAPANVFTLRSIADADRIIASLPAAKHAVIIGASFIGMEAASALKTRGLDVTVVGIEKIPFDRIFGNEIGALFQKAHESHGIKFRLDNQVKALHAAGGTISGVELKGGEILPADIVIVGVGVLPATDFLKGTGILVSDKDGSVIVTESLETSQPDIYAAGDIARIGNVRIEHWRVAQQQGIAAARNMLGKKNSMEKHVPFFWTNQWDIHLRYAGHAEQWDRILWRGDVSSGNFSAFYMSGKDLLAAAGCGRDTDICAVEFIIRDRIPVTDEQLIDASFNLTDYVKTIK